MSEIELLTPTPHPPTDTHPPPVPCTGVSVSGQGTPSPALWLVTVTVLPSNLLSSASPFPSDTFHSPWGILSPQDVNKEESGPFLNAGKDTHLNCFRCGGYPPDEQGHPQIFVCLTAHPLRFDLNAPPQRVLPSCSCSYYPFVLFTVLITHRYFLICLLFLIF